MTIPLNQVISSSSTSPTGTILPFGGTVASIPSGYLACDGSVVAQATFPTLFAVLGTKWDTGGEGGGNFRLPDLRGKSFVGLNDGTLPAGEDGGFATRVLAALGGTEVMTSHTHLLTQHAHNFDPIGTAANAETTVVASGAGALVASADHSHDIGSGTTADAGAAGDRSGTPSNMTPFAVAPYIIKT